MSPRIQIEEKFTYNPPEAHAAASAYRSAASDLRAQAQQVTGVRGSLEGTWYGNAKNIFFGNSDGTAKFFTIHANVLDQLAAEAEKPVTVTRKVWVWVDEEDA